MTYCSLEKIQEYDVPSLVYSASLLIRDNVFVCAGEDFKMYKFNYADGAEIGRYDVVCLCT